MWMPIGIDGYEVSDGGEVRGRHGVIKPEPSNGYLRVRIKHKNYRIHRLVLEAFVGPAPDGSEAAHLDGIRTNNRLSNLAWKTRQEQHQDRHRHGTSFSGSKSWFAKLTEDQVAEIRRLNQSGTTQKSLAAQFGVSQAHISKILSHQAWR